MFNFLTNIYYATDRPGKLNHILHNIIYVIGQLFGDDWHGVAD